MSKLEQKKIYLTLDEIFEDLTGPNENTKWKLVRERDNLTKYSEKIMWLEWNEDRSFKAKHTFIDVGFSLMMSPFTRDFTWQTTFITEIIKQTPNYMEFKTTNSTYKLTKYDNKGRNRILRSIRKNRPSL